MIFVRYARPGLGARLAQASLAVLLVLTPALARAQAVPETGNGFFNANEIDQMPKPTALASPKYPAEWLQKGISGWVRVAFVITQTGDVTDARAVQSSNPEFEAPAIEAVMSWKFQPGLKAGREVNVRASQLIKFNADKVPHQEASGDKEAAVVNVNELGVNDVRPLMIKQVTPEFPSSMFQAGVSGNVTVEYVIDTKGRVREAKAVRSSNPAFEAPALAALKQCQFTPGKKDGQSVSVRVAQTIEFERH